MDEAYTLKALCSYSVKSLENVAEVGLRVSRNLAGASLDPRIADRICLAAEEIGVYIVERCGTDTAVDFLVSTNGSDFTLTCRSSGEPFCPINSGDSNLSPNELFLVRLFKVKYEYIFGLNSVSLTIGAPTP